MFLRKNENGYSHSGVKLALSLLLVVTFLVPGLFAGDKETLPEVSFDGLKLAETSKYGFVYLDEDVDFSKYNKLILMDCQVAFEKNWARNFNKNAGNSVSANKVSDHDIERIKTDVAKLFNEVFTRELKEKGGIPLVTAPEATALVLRPAIINLNISAPVVDTSYRTRVSSAGYMTLYLEIFDSVSGDLLGRVVDQRQDQFHAFAQWATKAFNKAAGDQMMTIWATQLREGFENAHKGKVKAEKK